MVSIDYGGVSSTLMFAACECQQCENITIVDDATLELTESFTVTLERTPNLHSRITLIPVDRDIEILDNDGRKYEFFAWVYDQLFKYIYLKFKIGILVVTFN